MQGKKWMIVVTDEQYEWIKSVSEKTDLKGSDIIREMIARIMDGNPKEFVSSLASTQLKNELMELEQKEQMIAQKTAELRKKLKQEGVAV